MNKPASIDPSYFALGEYLSSNIIRMKEMLLSGEFPSAAFVSKVTKLCKDMDIMIYSDFKTIDMVTYFQAFVESIYCSNRSIFESILSQAISCPIKIALFMRFGIISIAILIATNSTTENSRRILFELSEYPVYPKKYRAFSQDYKNFVRYVKHLVMTDLSHFASSLRSSADILRDIIIGVAMEKDTQFLSDITKDVPVILKSSINTLYYEENGRKYLLFLLEFIIENSHILYIDQVPDEPTGNICFPYIFTVHITRIAFDIIALYLSEEENVKKLAEDAFYSLLSKQNILMIENNSIQLFFGFMLPILQKLLGLLYEGNYPSDIEYTARILRSIHFVVDSLDKLGFIIAAESSVESIGYISRLVWTTITNIEARLFIGLSIPEGSILSPILKSFGALGSLIEKSLKIFYLNYYEFEGLKYTDIYPADSSSNKTDSRTSLYKVYKELSDQENDICISSFSSRYIKISSLFCQSEMLSQGVLQGLTETFKSWKDIMGTVLQTKDSTVTINDRVLLQWNNQIYLLCALGIVKVDEQFYYHSDFAVMITETFESLENPDNRKSFSSKNIQLCNINNKNQVDFFLRVIVSHWFENNVQKITESGILYTGKLLNEAFVSVFVGQILLHELETSPVIARTRAKKFTGVDLGGENGNTIPYSSDYDNLFKTNKSSSFSIGKSVSVVTSVLLIIELIFERMMPLDNNNHTSWIDVKVIEKIFIILLEFGNNLPLESELSRAENAEVDITGTTNNILGFEDHRNGLTYTECFRLKNKIVNTIRIFICKCNSKELSLDFRHRLSSNLIGWILESLANNYNYTHNLIGITIPSNFCAKVLSLSEKKNVDNEMLQSLQVSCLHSFSILASITPLGTDVYIDIDDGISLSALSLEDEGIHDVFKVNKYNFSKNKCNYNRITTFAYYFYVLSNLYVSTIKNNEAGKCLRLYILNKIK